MLNDFIANGSLTCRNCRVDKIMCQSMKIDESKGVCRNGKMKCRIGYIGADCSHNLLKENSKFNFKGFKVIYY
jgi:hypothetical protein